MSVVELNAVLGAQRCVNVGEPQYNISHQVIAVFAVFRRAFFCEFQRKIDILFGAPSVEETARESAFAVRAAGLHAGVRKPKSLVDVSGYAHSVVLERRGYDQRG